MHPPPTRIIPPKAPAETAERKRLAKEINGPMFAADLLLLRGIRDKEGARAFFLPEPAPVSTNALLHLDRAVSLLLEAKKKGERLAVHGDYDVDGVVGTALLYMGLKGLGFDAIWHLPNRFAGGYGINPMGLDTLKARGAHWVISVDTGISARPEIAYAKQIGLKVIITDHHQAPPELPDADAIVNPNQPGCPYLNKGLSGCGVAWRLLEALTTILNGPSADRYLDLVALGSLADNVPSEGENRGLLRAGLRRMAATAHIGLHILLRRTGFDPASPTTSDLLFKVTPLLNAMGRMGSPEVSLRLFLSETEAEAHTFVDKMESENQKRRQLDQSITVEAIAQVEAEQKDAPCLVVHSRAWHEGVIGIVAARLVDKYRRPSFVLAVDEKGFAKASGRTVPGFNLHEAISGCSELFEKWGGHAFACGFTLREDRIGAFRSAMLQSAQRLDGKLAPEIAPSLHVAMEEIDDEGLTWLRRFEPFGPKNEAPLFYAEDLELDGDPRVVGEKHLKFSVRHGDQAFDAIAFNLGHRAEWLRTRATLARLCFYPEWNVFRGRKSIQLRVTAME